MNNRRDFDREYFEGIYTHLKKEKSPVLKSFFNLLILKKPKIEKLLDEGCGEGEFLEICQRTKIKCFGVDISSYALSRAKEKVKGNFLAIDLEKKKLPYPDNFFDTVTAFDLLEHLRKPEFCLREVCRVLKKDGVFFATTPNADFFLAKALGKVIPGDNTHVNLQGVGYWQAKLKQTGFSETEIKGCLLFGFPPSLDFRWFLKRLGLPVCTRPIFSSILRFTPELFIFSKKMEVHL